MCMWKGHGMSLEKAMIIVEKSLQDTSKAASALSQANKFKDQEFMITAQVASTAADVLNDINTFATGSTISKTAVQFNPNTIRISNQAKSVENTNNQSGTVSTNELQNNELNFNITLHYSKTDEVSVQDKIEAFMGLVLLDKEPRITFLWGAMFFTGMLGAVSPKYMSFNQKGEPTYGTVDLTIKSTNADTTAVQYWEQQLKRYL